MDATTIRVAVPSLANASARSPARRATKALFTFFNTRFQLYGRKLVQVDTSDLGIDDEPAVIRATAKEVAEKGVFASTEHSTSGDQALFRDYLAKRGILTVASKDPSLRSDELETYAPYQWSYSPPLDVLEAAAGRFLCTSLVGRTPYTGGTAERKFAVMVEEKPTYPIDPLLDTLTGCGVSPIVGHFTNPVAPDGTPTCELAPPPELTSQMISLSEAGVTTVVVIENEQEGIACLQTAAQNVAWTPEWFLPQIAGPSVTVIQPRPSQMANTFGFENRNKPLLSDAETPRSQAINAGGGVRTDDRLWFQDALYEQLLVLASGIQAAGPRLNAHSFGSGLHGTDFPNPGAARAPRWQATVGFPDDEPWFVRDIGVWWWEADESNPSDTEVTADAGGRCFAERGARWAPTAWSRPIRLFTSTCR